MNSILIKDQESIEGDRPAHLSNGLPSMLMIYSEICEPYVTGDVQTRLLRAVSLNIDDYTYGSTLKSRACPHPSTYRYYSTHFRRQKRKKSGF